MLHISPWTCARETLPLKKSNFRFKSFGSCSSFSPANPPGQACSQAEASNRWVLQPPQYPTAPPGCSHPDQNTKVKASSLYKTPRKVTPPGGPQSPDSHRTESLLLPAQGMSGSWWGHWGKDRSTVLPPTLCNLIFFNHFLCSIAQPEPLTGAMCGAALTEHTTHPSTGGNGLPSSTLAAQSAANPNPFKGTHTTPYKARFPHLCLLSERGHSLRNQGRTRARESSPRCPQSS